MYKEMIQNYSRFMKIDEKKVSFEIASSTQRIATVIHNLENFLASIDCSGDIAGEVTLAVSEAVTNAIVHGNKKDARKKVSVSFRATGSELLVLVDDQGPGFNPNDIPDPMLQKNRMKTSGRGIYLMQALMDKVIFKRNRNGMQVKMIKYLKNSH